MATSTLPTKILPFPTERPLGGELPSDIESEKSVLGSILLNREAILAIRDWLTPDRFYLARHAQIYQAMLDLVAAGTPPDTRLVAGELKVRGQLESVGGLLYLTELVESVPTSYHIEHYAQAVDKTGWLRELIQTGGRLAALGYGSSADTAASEAEALVAALFTSRFRGPAPQTDHISGLWQKEFPPPVWVIDGLLLEGLTLFSGKPKMGKGLVVTNLAAAVASGGKALGVADVLQGDVLYLAMEDPEPELQARFERALGGRPDDIPLHYKMDWRPLLQGGLLDIERWLVEHPAARLIVIDTFSALAPEEDGKKSAYRADYQALRPLQQLAGKYPGLAILAITHSRKAGANDVLDEVSGTTGKSGAVDHVWVMRRDRGEPVAELHGELRRAASWAKQILFDPALASWRLGEDADVARRSTIRHEILEVLVDGEAWPKDIAESFDGDRAQVRKQLGVLKRLGQIETADRGKYRITEAGRQALLRSDPGLIPDDPRDPQGSEDQGSDLTRQPIRRPTGVWRDWDAPADDPPAAAASARGLIPDPLILEDQPDPADQTWDQTPNPMEPLDLLLTKAPPRERFYIRMYLRSMKPADQGRARAKCDDYGIDYAAAYRCLHGTDPPDDE